MTATESRGPDAASPDSLERRIADGPRGGAKTWYDVLEVSLDVSPVDLQKAYERALALVEGRSIGGYLMLDPMAAESARADVEAAYAVLGDPERRRAYLELLTGGADAAPASAPTSAVPPTLAQPPAPPTVHEATAPVERTPDQPAAPIAGWSAEGEAVAEEAAAEARAILGLPEGDPQADERRSSQLKFLAPEGNADAPPRTETPRPGSIDIRFAAPSTDSGPAAAMPAEPQGGRTPPSGIGTPPLTTPGRGVSEVAALSATSTVSPTATMPAPLPAVAPSVSPGAPPSEVHRSSELPDEVTGGLIKALREERGLTVDDVSLQTKVRRAVLQAIEEQDLPNLPARVYLRGFLTQVGRVLKVDRTRLAEGYLKTIEKAQRG
ncbi:MAG: helix-turn-helix domain-containing protein [Deltaproteobacteria bacterium]|nr:helix-turn-helix domain-containing protein [Deltaproteobacteria bacterium]